MSERAGPDAQKVPYPPVLVPLLIRGREEIGEGAEYEVRNPADPSQIVAFGRSSTREQVRAAIDAAWEASGEWARTPGPQRGALLNRAAAIMRERSDELARLITLEEGKPLVDSSTEVARAVDTLHFYAALGRLSHGETLPSSQPGQLVYTKRQPIGVVALITPWNFPLAIPVQKLAPALVQGNAVVLKPSSYTPAVAYQVCRVLHDAGLPDGVLNLIVGSGSDVGPSLVAAPTIGAVSFTGSRAVGTALSRAAAGSPVRLQLELGGKNPLLVLADADLGTALDVAVRGTFGLTGQSCTATGRILVERPLYGAFVEGLAKRAASIVVGNGLAPDVQMGPKVSRAELDTALTRLERGLAEGSARLVSGGTLMPEMGPGFFLAPTVLSDVFVDSELGSEELFSPVACVTAVDSFDEGVALANQTAYGLVAAICTRNLKYAHEFVDRVDAGVVKVNTSTTGLELHVPFGGFKESSSGTAKELGTESLNFFTKLKSVYLTYT